MAARWDRFPVSVPVACFLVALVIRLAMTPVSVLTELNQYALADATEFADTAEYIADGVSSGVLFEEGGSYIEGAEKGTTYQRWGVFLAFAWVLPGPSIWYATMFVGLLGAISTYNVAKIGEHLHSPTAGGLAALPMIVFPSHVFVQTAVIRDAGVVFAITMTAVLLIVTVRDHPILAMLGAGLSIGMVALLRPENVPLLVGTVMVALGFHLVPVSRYVLAGVAGCGLIGFITAIPSIPPLYERITYLREVRYGGRTAYLESIPLETSTDVLFSSGLAAMHFLFTPFPWMVRTTADGVIAVEAAISMVYLLGALYGIAVAFRRSPAITTALVLGFVVAVVVYGLVTVNVGTATRHRQSFLWVLFLFGSIGGSELLSSHADATTHTPRGRITD